MDAGTDITCFAWVGKDDVFAILHNTTTTQGMSSSKTNPIFHSRFLRKTIKSKIASLSTPIATNVTVNRDSNESNTPAYSDQRVRV